MIIWIASYPKSGNTYIRSLLSAYYFSKDGNFNFDLLKNIKQFPNTEFFNSNINSLDDASNNWLYAQKKIKEQNKIKFLKTHSCLGAYKGKPFTTVDYSLGGIYVVRDPRNVISSVMNHFSLNADEAFNFMTDIHRGTRSNIENDYSAYSYLSTWANHYKSWAKSKNFRKIIIKYEELETNKYETFRDIIVFTNTLLNNSDGVNKIKLEKAIETTNFNVLKNKEKNEGFDEALYSEDKKEKKVFFNMGFNNRWKKILREDIRKKLEDVFKNEMKDIGYI
tara:strand:- start:1614 stop:2450 length:837 start_codon:yes stop_codon:yes gene_type:complete